MPRQQVLHYERDEQQFRVSLKRDLSGDPPIVLIIGGILCFIFFNIAPSVYVKLIVVCLFVALLYRLLHDLMLLRTITVDAGTVRVEYQYGQLFDPEIIKRMPLYNKFGGHEGESIVQFFKWIRDHCFWSYSPKIYNRKNLHMPVSRVIFLKKEKSEHTQWRTDWIYRYETRIPLSETGGYGIILAHPSEKAMGEFETQIKTFWHEIPYNEEVWYEANPTAALRRYEVPANRFETPPFARASKKLTITIVEKANELSIVSQYGSTVSCLIAKTLYVLRRLTIFVMLFVLLGLIGGFIYLGAFWNDIEETVQPYIEIMGPKAIVLYEIGAEKFIHHLPVDQETKDELRDNMEKALIIDNPSCERAAIITCIVFGYPAFCIALWVLFLFLRYPFWKRWTVLLENTALRPHQIYSNWQTDRFHVKRPVYHYGKFFDVIAAMPKTHRLVTGKKFFCADPGWHFPLQVVIITPEGAIPIPVNSEEEQKEVMATLKRFSMGISKLH